MKSIEYKLVNIVSCGRIIGLNKTIGLDDLAMKLMDNGISAEYEPECFPGIVIKSEEPKVSFLLFATGKIICTGVKSEKGIEDAFDMFEDKILPVIRGKA